MITKKEHERHYFVDEAGDLVLFDKRGRVIVGTEGCSKHFILGCALVDNPHEARRNLAGLRREILADSYLQGIPSLMKTKLAFHAKDDCPEVRMQVYKLLGSLSVRFYAIVRRKEFLSEWVAKQNQYDPDWWYNDNKIYDASVKRLFKDRLHSAEINHITFARRGKSPRNEALTNALMRARQNFENTHDKRIDSIVHVAANYPSDEPALQIIDYGLWALQRLYERGEERHFDFLRDKFVRIIDLDDKRQKDYGVYYDARNPLTAEKIKNPSLG